MYAGAAAQTIGQSADNISAAVREDYLPDLTRPYHNLLSVTRNDNTPAQTFYWDSSTAAMEENGAFHYYLQDEMGSPIRGSGYDSEDSMADGNHDAAAAYLTYGYDEFGNDLARTIGRELEGAGIPNPYTEQGEGQPFGYTGYRYDTLGATYFAQAREYDPQTRRFCAQDVIAGNGAVPVTLNRYTYCLGNPVGLVDLDGNEGSPWWIRVMIPDMRPAGTVIADEISDTVQDWIAKSNNVVAQVMRGDIGIELTDAELELMALYPDQAVIFLRDGYRATKLTEEKYGFTPEDGTLGNAYRHAMWNALLKQSFHNEKTAKMWTDAHEDYPEERLLNEEWKGHTRKEHCEMDLHNNAVGLDVIEWYEWWISTDEISNRIMERINNGEMMVLVDDPRCDLEGEE